MEATDWSKVRDGEQISSRCITLTEQTTTTRHSKEERNRFYSFATVTMIAEDQFRQNMEEFNPMAALLGMDVTLRREVHPERARINELIVNQHNEDIESLKKQIDEKNKEIVDLRKAMDALEEQNQELNVALKSRNEEIKALKARLGRLEKDKKELEDELRSVKVKVDRMESDIKELSEAKLVQEEKNIELQESLGKVSGKMESRNQAIKKEIKEMKELQHKEIPPSLVLPRPVRQITPALLPKHLQQADRQLHASLSLGELCRQLQNKMYKIVFPYSFSSGRNYKMKNIHRDLDKLPQPTEEKERSKTKWGELNEKFQWEEAYEEAMKALQESRNIDAHPSPLTEEGLIRAAEILNAKGDLKGWLSLKRVHDLIHIWKQLQTFE